jgi:hypothetical protein
VAEALPWLVAQAGRGAREGHAGGGGGGPAEGERPSQTQAARRAAVNLARLLTSLAQLAVSAAEGAGKGASGSDDARGSGAVAALPPAVPNMSVAARSLQLIRAAPRLPMPVGPATLAALARAAGPLAGHMRSEQVRAGGRTGPMLLLLVQRLP